VTQRAATRKIEAMIEVPDGVTSQFAFAGLAAFR
jgi:hypothetical protein